LVGVDGSPAADESARVSSTIIRERLRAGDLDAAQRMLGRAYEVRGDVAHGDKIFWSKGRCAECHMIRGRGGILGPDLSNIGGEQPLSAIRESLTKTKQQIPRGYQPVEVVTADGRRLSGIAKNDNNFSMQLLDNQGRLDLFTRDELREVIYDRRSLMPSDFETTLTTAELRDLLAFLSRQAIQGAERPEENDEEQP